MTLTELSTEPSAEPRLYPVALRVTGRSCLVVGGGGVAARKVRSLVEAGAVVTVVSPELGADLTAARSEDALWTWQAREFRAEDVDGCLLVVAATDDSRVNRAVAAAAAQAGALRNVVDDPEASDFFVPSVIQRGQLQLTVGTGGAAPAVAAAVKRRLESAFPAEWGEAVAILGRAREEASARGLDEQARRGLALELAGLDIDMILTEGGVPSFVEAVTACISRFSA
jgi:siroheme synthase-like protein